MSFDMSWINTSVSVSDSVATDSAWVVGDDWLYQDYSDVVVDDIDDDLGWDVGEASDSHVWNPEVDKLFALVVDKSWKKFDIPF